SGNRPELKPVMNYAAFSYRSSQCLYLSEKFMKLLTPIHLLGVALFFSMVSNSHGQDALNPIAKGAPNNSRNAFHSPSQPTGGKISFFTRWLSAVGPETQVCQDGTLIDSDDGGLVSQVPT
ncbi:hypothetical protein N9074_03320, partial [Akkermansiaceae bacterium]|nr:hypothetical protein [Akkermansiaceae bacterium]